MTVLAPPRGLVGQPIRRREDVRFLTGTARYLDDVELPGALHLAFVRTPYAHARVVAIDAATSRKHCGVAAVFTAAELGGRTLPLPRAFPNTTIAAVPHPVLAGDVVRYAGQAVAAVAAASRALAEDAADAIVVEYDELPFVLDPRVALSRDAPRLELGLADNVAIRFAHRRGDVEAAFARAHARVGRAFRIPRVAIAALETRGIAAAYDPGTDLLTVWCSAQDSHRWRQHLARVLDRPEDRIHVIVPDVGGGFGSKSYPQSEAIVTAFAAIALRRPVKWVEDRLENFRAAHHGRGMDIDAELALDADGRILALRARLIADLGGYLYSSTPNNGRTAADLITGVYDVPVVDVELCGVLTNKVPTSPYRGAGRPEAAIVVEGLVELAARELRVDPVELRRRNLVRTFPYPNAMGITYDSGDYPRLLERLVARAELPRRRDDQALARLERRLVGIGIGMYVERSGGGWESAAASIEPGGRVVARIGSSPHGQGHETAFAQVIADVLRVPLDDVVVRWGDSSEVPRGVGTFASRSMTMGGSALHRAAQRVRAKTELLAAHLLAVPVAELEWDAGVVHARSDRARALALAELAAAAWDPARVPPEFDLGLAAQAHFAADYCYAAGAHLAVVEIDRGTGAIAVRAIVAVDDPGRLVNPLLAEGQVVGGIAQGLGEALFEEAAHTASGTVGAVSFLDYGVITAVEMPPVVTEFCETPSPLNPLGVKGVGEGGACGAPAAVANAVADALAPLGLGPLDMPFTAEKLWRALHTQGATP